MNRRWGWAAMKRNARRDGTNRVLITRYRMEGARFDRGLGIGEEER